MARPILQERNERLRQTYKKLTRKGISITMMGRRIDVPLTSSQVVQILGKAFYISPRTVENILERNEEKE